MRGTCIAGSSIDVAEREKEFRAFAVSSFVHRSFLERIRSGENTRSTYVIIWDSGF